ncbi:otolith matrix protein 1 isoform X2 [Phyllopteryx taeniolatus]|uniref:otolith matrix protein 1 isoform X2 n=1 Tax=Phyllopteryx taeniolatus TaxID=161469 RepID=UPI002AD38CBE|nr:otolith matrix protein 1 isoform X2 [Phyllopteryx taeniolatus]
MFLFQPKMTSPQHERPGALWVGGCQIGSGDGAFGDNFNFLVRAATAFCQRCCQTQNNSVLVRRIRCGGAEVLGPGRERHGSEYPRGFANGSADAASMFADDIYAAGLCHGLEVAAGESLNGVDGVSYYVVALARRSSSDLSLLEMHERSSCHPGMRTTVGWTVPVGYLLNTSQISVGNQCNFPRAVGNLFGYSCVPGVKDPQHDPRGNNPKNLCEACIGDDNDRHICASNPRERHYGEAGALRCVAENLGDVAFVKHTTVFDNLDGRNQESWALDVEAEDLKLLCPDGTEADLDDFRLCHLAAVPANGVVVRQHDKCRIWKFLERLQNVFGNSTDGLSMFSSAGYSDSDVLFTDSTHRLLRVLGGFTSWLGPSYTSALQAFECEGFC